MIKRQLPQLNSRIIFLLTIAIILLLGIYRWRIVGVNPFALGSAKLISFALLWGVCLTGLGKITRIRLLKISDSCFDLILGLGIFAFFLNIYFKLSLSLVLPICLLSAGLVYQIIALKKDFPIRSPITSSGPFLIFFLVTALPLLALQLPFFGTEGWLVFPKDYDSGIFHVSFPLSVVLRGQYYSPDALRGAFIPQLTHHLYIFVIKAFNVQWIKSVNMICYAQIFILAWKRSRHTLWTFIITCALIASFEFKTIITSASLDAVLGTFVISAWISALTFLKTKKASYLYLTTILSAFAAGQKHFGLLLLAPILFILCSFWIIDSYYNDGLSVAAKKIRISALLAVVYCAIASIFYIHNVLSGNSILFPFLGSWKNSYGWTYSDLKDFTSNVVSHWGYSKSFGAFFLLPYTWIRYPEKYQFGQVATYNDYWLSLLVCAQLSLLASLLIFRKKCLALFDMSIIELAFIIMVPLLELFFWYKGSQVYRYLFPINLILTFAWIDLVRTFKIKPPKKALIIPTLGILYLLNPLQDRPAQRFFAPLNQKALTTYLSENNIASMKSYDFLRTQKSEVCNILNIASPSMMEYYVDLPVVGDWFGKYRWFDFIKPIENIPYIRFLPRKLFIAKAKELCVTHVLVNWNNFSTRRPKDIKEWSDSIPADTAQCLHSLFFDRETTEVFEIKKGCLK